MYTKYNNWEGKSDEWLAEAIYRAAQEGNAEERDIAIDILVNRHKTRLSNLAAARLRGNREMAKDILQDVWWMFTAYADKERMRGRVGGLLTTITIRRCIDEARRQRAEYLIENDIPSGQNVEEAVLDDMIEQEFDELTPDRVKDMLLSDCERVLTTLRGTLKFSWRTVGRLLGKTPHNANVQFKNAKHYVNNKLHNDDFYSQMNEQKQDKGLHHESEIQIELFSNHIKPQFTPDELIPLDRSIGSLRENVITSLILPKSQDHEKGYQFRVFDEITEIENEQLYLVLMNEHSIDILQDGVEEWLDHHKTAADRQQWKNYNDYSRDRLKHVTTIQLIKLDVIEDNFILNPQGTAHISFFDLPRSPASIYLSSHRFKKRVPIDIIYTSYSGVVMKICG